MRLPYNGNYPRTQGWNDPCCRASYAKFGMSGHNGWDIGLPCGTPVVAPFAGSVYSGNDPSGYGLFIFVSDGSKEAVVAHLSRIDVKSGGVAEGQYIGLSGTTGNSNGCHLHFGIRPLPYNNNNGFLGYVDPENYFKGGDMLTPGQQDKLIKGILGREPNATELNDTNWRDNPGLAIDTLWEHGGKQRFAESKAPKDYAELKPGKYLVK